MKNHTRSQLHSKTVYCLNPNLRAYYSSQQSELEIPLLDTKKSFSVNSKQVIAFLLSLPSEFSKDYFITSITRRAELKKAQAEKLFLEMENSNILIYSNEAFTIRKRRDFWSKFGWKNAFDYFTFIYDYPFLDYSTNEAELSDQIRMEKYVTESKPPSSYKETKSKNFGCTKLMWSSQCFMIPFSDVSSDYIYKKQRKLPFTIKNVGDFLFFAFGKIGEIAFSTPGEFLLKTSPSGGARHPIECYVLLFDKKRNTYTPHHYNVKQHSLDKISSESLPSAQVEKAIYDLQNTNHIDKKFVIIYTTIFERSMWRYRESRAYRATLHDLGHLMETVNILAKSNGWRTYSNNGYREDKVGSLLRLRPFQEETMGFTIIGI